MEAPSYREFEHLESGQFFDVFAPSGAADVHVLRGKGVFSWGSAGELKDLHSRYDSRLLVVDMADVSWVDGPGLGGLMRAHLKCSRRKKSFRLCNLPNDVEALLTFHKALPMLSKHATLQEALLAEVPLKKSIVLF